MLKFYRVLEIMFEFTLISILIQSEQFDVFLTISILIDKYVFKIGSLC